MSDADRKYKVLTPKTSFGIKPNPQKEQEILEEWAELDIYDQMRKKSNGRDFILHDGPPYANGNIHIGHALNKILKDLTNRYRYISGSNINYIPGWDCHGLPIEWKVETEYRKQNKNKDDDLRAFRNDCRDYAKKWIDIQREEFKRLGVIGDWDNPYTTMKYDNEASIVQQLHKFLMADLLVQKNKPIMWSPVEKTALAEAEVEYKDVDTTSVFVGLDIYSSVKKLENVKLLIWTTTPWTLPGNQGVAYNPTISYCLIKDGKNRFLIAEKLVDEFQKSYDGNLKTYDTISEKSLLDINVRHPIYNRIVPVVEAGFVTDEQGTGFVHIAPAHGMDDFLLGVEHGWSTDSIIDDNGCYNTNVEIFEGIHVYKANEEVMEHLDYEETLVAKMVINHSYPHSWRSKKPVIYKTTPQWFIDLEHFRERSLEAIDDVNWYPQSGRNRLYNMVDGRQDWCISRQRAWGVPIAIFVNRETGELLHDYQVNEKVIAEIKEHGCDIWFEQSTEYFIEDADKAKKYKKITDILDVWFDSGSTHAFVLNNDRADVYLEGSDQHRGWFQSSLLISTALGGTAPYKDVVTHGFVMVSDKGEKMSKSSNNYVTPQAVMKQYGADTLRLWVATADYTTDLTINGNLLQQLKEQVRKFRNTIRYCLGNLHDIKEVEEIDYNDLPPLEKYIINRMLGLKNEIGNHILKYEYTRITSLLVEFCNELSSLYFDVRKDCLYCDAKDTLKRKSSLYTLSLVFDFLTLYLAPLMPFSVYEAYRTRHNYGAGCFARSKDDVKLPIDVVDNDVIESWRDIKNLRSSVLANLESLRQDDVIGSSLEAEVSLLIDEKMSTAVSETELAEIFIVSKVNVDTHDSDEIKIIVNTIDGNKCPRCWIYHNGDDLCLRCIDVERNPHV